LKQSREGDVEFDQLRLTRVSDCETSLCGDDNVTSSSRTPTIIGDNYISRYKARYTLLVYTARIYG